MSENFNYGLERHPETGVYVVRSEGGVRIGSFKISLSGDVGKNNEAVFAHGVASRMADEYRRLVIERPVYGK